MPDFTPDDISIEPYEYLNSCGPRDIEELIEELVGGGYLPTSVLKLKKKNKPDNGLGRLQSDFAEKLEKLTKVYYSLSKEDEEILESLFKKYI
jgi:hypothetical protein